MRDDATMVGEDREILPFRSIIDAAPDGVMIIDTVSDGGGRQFRLKYVNARCRQILGLSTEPADGSDVGSVAPELVRHGILQRFVETGDDGGLEGNWQSRSGRFIGWRASLADGFVVLRLRDVTRIEQLRDSERMTRRRLSEILTSISDALVVLDPTLRFTYVNAEASRLIRRSPERLLGGNVWEELPLLVGSEFERQLERVVRDGVDVAFEAADPLDDNVWVSVRAYPSEVGITIYFRDIGAERRFSSHAAEIQRAKSLVTFTGGVAHDFNNLLTVLNGHAALLGAALDATDPAFAHLEAIQTAAGRAGDLTRQLLAYSQQQMVSPTPVDLNEILRDAWPSLCERAGSGVTVDVECIDASVMVNVDRRELVQCLHDLVDNARDAMPGGGTVAITTSLETTSFGSSHPSRAQPMAVISVADEGTGMSREVRAHAVEPFFTYGRGGTRTGLGLSAADGMVKQAGGQLVIDSKAGEGTVVRINLPLCVVDPSVLPEGPVGAAAADPLESTSILVVDDNPDVGDLVARFLSEQGYVVAATRDSSSAIELAHARSSPFDLVLTDVVMPGLSGFELAETLSRDPHGPAVLFMSGFADHSQLMGLPTSTVHGFLAKPFTANEMLSKVRQVLADRVASAAKGAP